jgi:hypothetical protein
LRLTQDGAVRLVSSLVNPVAFDRVEEAPVKIGSFIGSYDKDDLMGYLNALQSASNDIPFSMRLGSLRHAVSLNRNANGWLLVDPNELPGRWFSDKDLPALVEALQKSMKIDPEKNSSFRTFTTDVYVNNKYLSDFTLGMESLKTDPIWIKAHEIKHEKTKAVSFFKLAITRGDDLLVKKLLDQEAIISEEDYVSILETATIHGKSDVIRVLLDFDQRCFDKLQATISKENYFLVLNKAIVSGKADTIKALLDFDQHRFDNILADPTPLKVACVMGDVGIIQMIFNAQQHLISGMPDFSHESFRTPAGMAIKEEIETKIIPLEPIQKGARIVLDRLTRGEIDNPEFKDNIQVMNLAIRNNSKAVMLASDELKNNPAFMLPIIKRNKALLRVAGPAVKDDSTIVFDVICKDPSYLQYASPRIQHDESFLLSAVEKNPEIMKYMGDDLKSKAFLLQAVEKKALAFYYFPEKFKNDEVFLGELIERNVETFGFMSEKFKNDETFALKAIERGYPCIDLPRTFRNEAFLLKAIKKNPQAMGYMPEPFRSDEIFALKAVEGNYKVYPYLLPIFKDQGVFLKGKEIVESMTPTVDPFSDVTSNGLNLSNHPGFQDNEEIVMAAVTQNPYALRYAGNNARNNPDIILKALVKDASYLMYASSRLQNDAAFLLKAIDVNLAVLNNIPERLKNRDFFLKCIERNPKAFTDVPERLKNEAFFLEALQKNIALFKYIPNTLPSYSEYLFIFVISSTKDDDFEYFPEALRNNRLFMLEAVTLIPGALQFASDELKHDSDFIEAAANRSDGVLLWACIDGNIELINRLINNGSTLTSDMIEMVVLKSNMDVINTLIFRDIVPPENVFDVCCKVGNRQCARFLAEKLIPDIVEELAVKTGLNLSDKVVSEEIKAVVNLVLNRIDATNLALLSRAKLPEIALNQLNQHVSNPETKLGAYIQHRRNPIFDKMLFNLKTPEKFEQFKKKHQEIRDVKEPSLKSGAELNPKADEEQRTNEKRGGKP